MEGGKSISNWFAGLKSYSLDAVPTNICVHSHLEMDRKYSARDIVSVELDETRMMGLPEGQKSFKIGLAV